MSIQSPPIIEPFGTETWNRWFENAYNNLKNINTEGDSTFSGNINITGDYQKDGTSGLSETLTFGGGASGEIATITVSGGIITARTLVP